MSRLPSPFFVRISGNPDFEAERMVGYEAGYRTRVGPRAYFDAAAFHDVHAGLGSFSLGQITSSSRRRRFTRSRMSSMSRRERTSDGFELSPDWQARRWWQLRGSYSYVRFNLANTPGQRRRQRGGALLGVEPAPSTSVSIAGQSPARRRSRCRLSLRQRASGAEDRLVSHRRHPDRLDASPSLALSIAGQNLFSPSHLEFNHNAGPAVGIARSVFVELRWRRGSGRP